jgi:macrophage erythroblast attacher
VNHGVSNSDIEQSDLEYTLRFQQLVELVRTRQPDKLIEATLHARKYLADNYHLSHYAAGLIAFAYESDNPNVMELYKVSNIFNIHSTS